MAGLCSSSPSRKRIVYKPMSFVLSLLTQIKADNSGNISWLVAAVIFYNEKSRQANALHFCPFLFSKLIDKNVCHGNGSPSDCKALQQVVKTASGTQLLTIRTINHKCCQCRTRNIIKDASTLTKALSPFAHLAGVTGASSSTPAGSGRTPSLRP